MRVVAQRVAQASVEIEQQCVGKIKKGLLIYLGIEKEEVQLLSYGVCIVLSSIRSRI